MCIKSINSKFMALTISTTALVLGATFSTNAMADSVTRSIANTAKSCVTSGLCKTTPTGRAFGTAVKSADELGWQMGRFISIRQNGNDPGKYPGIKR